MKGAWDIFELKMWKRLVQKFHYNTTWESDCQLQRLDLYLSDEHNHFLHEFLESNMSNITVRTR